MDRGELRFRAVALAGRGLLASYFRFFRCFREGTEHFQQFRERGQPVIFVFWHGQLLPLVHYHRNEGVVVLTTRMESTLLVSSFNTDSGRPGARAQGAG
jgi:lysophospholipid acyltransferase (LPLAT)-like uncharacterized protein